MEGVLFIVLNYCDGRENEVSSIVQTLVDNVRDTRVDYGNTCRSLHIYTVHRRHINILLSNLCTVI